MGGGGQLVHARELAKKFGDFEAVRGIDLDVSRGEAFGFLGPNGAGKSSTMRMLGCVSPPSGGELSIVGLDPVRDGPVIRARLGVVPQEDTLDVELTVRENLLIYGRYFGLPRPLIRERTARLLEFVLFVLLNGVGTAIQLLCLGCARYVLGFTGPVALNIALLLGIGLGTLFRFWSYRTWVFLARALPVPAAQEPGEEAEPARRWPAPGWACRRRPAG